RPSSFVARDVARGGEACFVWTGSSGVGAAWGSPTTPKPRGTGRSTYSNGRGPARKRSREGQGPKGAGTGPRPEGSPGSTERCRRGSCGRAAEPLKSPLQLNRATPAGPVGSVA